MTTDRSHNRNPRNTNNTTSQYTIPVITHIVLAITLTACGPGPASGGESGETSGETGGELPTPGDEVDCRDMGQAVACWVTWEMTYAQVFLDCERDQLVTLNVWSESYAPTPGVDPALDAWGDGVFCHDYIGLDGSICFYGGNVLLAKTIDGWAPILDPTINDYPLADPPCGEVAGDGDGDGDPGDGDGDGDPIDDGRLRLVEFQCVADVCQGRWEGTELWSLVSDAADVAASVEIGSPWTCETAPDVDVCIEVDMQGHVGCFWYQDEWAVAVVPSCAVGGDPWLDVGNDMRSSAA